MRQDRYAWLEGNIRPGITWKWAETAEPMMAGCMAQPIRAVTAKKSGATVVAANLTPGLPCREELPARHDRARPKLDRQDGSNAARFLDVFTTAPFAASKAAIVVFSRHFAKEFGPRTACASTASPPRQS